MVGSRGRRRASVKMEDVARRAGVSAITVSRVLKNPALVAAETRKRVLDAVRETNYVPNLLASSLASRRSGVIAAIVPSIGNPVFADTLTVIDATLRDRGFHLLLGQSGAKQKLELSLITTFMARQPDALFLHGGDQPDETRRLLSNSGIPIVETGDLRPNPIDMAVGFSNFAAAKTMTSYLVQKGHRSIGFVSPPLRENDRARARRRGYQQALASAGLPFNREAVVETQLGLERGASALEVLLDRVPELDAVFFAADVLAVGGLLACQHLGVKVPEQLSITGFDNQEIARMVTPALTTVHVRRDAIGQQAANMILARLDGRDVPERIVDVGYDIVERESVLKR